jgi:hypothetical protein
VLHFAPLALPERWPRLMLNPSSTSKIMPMRFRLRTVAFFAAFVFPFAAGNGAPASHPPIVKILDTSSIGAALSMDQIQLSAGMWAQEVSRRFSGDVVIVMAHGGEVASGVWACQADGGTLVPWTTELTSLRSEYPASTLVLISCNPNGEVLHGFPDVFYATSSVWECPDRFVDNQTSSITTERISFPSTCPAGRWANDASATGNIFEFVSAE